MSDGSRISWTHATWGPTLGCRRISAGCEYCYAIRTSHRLAHNPNARIQADYEGLTERRDGRLDWVGTVRTVPHRLRIPLTWRKPRRVFVDSQSDLFHDDVPDAFIARVWAVMALTPQHTYQILTKRPARMRSLLTSGNWTNLVPDGLHRMLDEINAPMPPARVDAARAWASAPERIADRLTPLPNVQLGVSVEDQHWAAVRIPILLQTPAAVRWVSAEPLLAALNLSAVRIRGAIRNVLTKEAADPRAGAIATTTPSIGLDWVVAGGESGPTARPADARWFRDLRDQCQIARVPFHFKQAGSVLAREWGCSGAGRDPAEWPEPFPQEFPRVAA